MDNQNVRQYGKKDLIDGLCLRDPKYTEPMLTGKFQGGVLAAYSNALTYLHRFPPEANAFLHLQKAATDDYLHATVEFTYDDKEAALGLLLSSLSCIVAYQAYDRGFYPVILSDIAFDPRTKVERLFSEVYADVRENRLVNLLRHMREAEPIIQPYYEPI